MLTHHEYPCVRGCRSDGYRDAINSALYANAEADTYARNLLLGFGFAAWNLGSFTASSTRINDSVSSLESLITIWGRAQDMAVGLNRVFEILDLEPEIQDAPRC
jgi:ABC-type multidrug transport system fused ATPase/permease subunit